jgi:hypothetical protein
VKRQNLKEASIDKLVEMFIDYATERHHIMKRIYIEGPGREVRDSNRLISRTHPVRVELFARGADVAAKLLPLLNHPLSWVRLSTAEQVVGFYEKEARNALQKIVAEAHQYDPIKGNAGMTLYFWDRGERKQITEPPPRARLQGAPAEAE